MRTYYRGPDAVVTDEHFIWRTSSTHIFAVDGLHNVGLVQGSAATVAPSTGTLVVAAGLFTAAALFWATFGAAVGYSIAALAVVVTAALMAGRYQRATRIWHLQATYRGIEVTLYSSPDARVFNQVARALRRSIEGRRHYQAQRGLLAA